MNTPARTRPDALPTDKCARTDLPARRIHGCAQSASRFSEGTETVDDGVVPADVADTGLATARTWLGPPAPSNWINHRRLLATPPPVRKQTGDLTHHRQSTRPLPSQRDSNCFNTIKAHGVARFDGASSVTSNQNLLRRRITQAGSASARTSRIRDEGVSSRQRACSAERGSFRFGYFH